MEDGTRIENVFVGPDLYSKRPRRGSFSVSLIGTFVDADPDPTLYFNAGPDSDPIPSFTYVEKSEKSRKIVIFLELILVEIIQNDADPTGSGSTTLVTVVSRKPLYTDIVP